MTTRTVTIYGFILKQNLEKLVYRKLNSLGIKMENYPIDSIFIAEKLERIYVETNRFNSINIGGILYKGQRRETSGICLNSKRSRKGRNFDCMHELIHYWFHPAQNHLCFDRDYIRQNKAIEWQANNGASYALMPTKLFKSKYKEYNGNIKHLSNFFNVGELSVQYRIDNLYLDMPEYYCYNCKNKNIMDGFYCTICGEQLTYNRKIKGVNFMIYDDGYELDSRSKALRCPKCDNEQILEQGEFCQICGVNLVNKCTNIGQYNDPPCETLLSSNARYCHLCGYKSTYYSDKVLVDWESYSKKEQLIKEEFDASDDDLPF